jgi:hypothetical protein
MTFSHGPNEFKTLSALRGPAVSRYDAQRPSSPAAMERSGIAVRCSALFGMESPPVGVASDADPPIKGWHASRETALERVMHFRLQVIGWEYGTQILPQRYQ